MILFAGGTKKRQDADISAAKAHWRDYKRRKREFYLIKQNSRSARSVAW